MVYVVITPICFGSQLEEFYSYFLLPTSTAQWRNHKDWKHHILCSESLSGFKVQRSHAERSLPALSLVFKILNQDIGNKIVFSFGFQTMRHL